MAGLSEFEYATTTERLQAERALRSTEWRKELADILDRLGTRNRNRPFTFENLDELIFQLRKAE